MKRLITIVFAACAALGLWAQGVMPLPSLHVEGKWLVDTHGNHVVLHGVMDTPSMWFNDNRWQGGYNSTGATNCLAYFEKVFKALEQAKCNVFRLHLDPAWTNDNSYTFQIAKDQPTKWTGEADIKHFNPTRLQTFLKSVYVPLMQKAMKHGMYVVVRPPGVCPGELKVGDYYQQYLTLVWDMVTQNDTVRKYAGQISIELANEPVDLKNAQGQADAKAMHDFFQPVVDKIRENGFTGIVWVPGTGWQSSYADYKNNPITGYNIGYAVHDYTGWYGCSDESVDRDKNIETSKKKKISQFHNQVPVVDTNPIIITEIDWSPKKAGTGHYNEHGEWVESNYGTWSTGSTSKWGQCYKAMLDHYGNISMTLSGSHCLIDIDKSIKSGKAEPAFGGLEEACGKACWDWYADWYNVDYPKADFQSVPVSDFGRQYQNPIVRADFPDPDVIRVGDTYYMVSTTMHHFPGATIIKSQDLVNWEYCAHPLKQLGSDAAYTLLNNKNAYASGMWACSMKYHNGKFHILINEKRPIDGWNLNGYLLTATNPEGEWTMKKLSRSYYDPGMLFDNGKVYVAQGIGTISVCELDENFNFKKEVAVIKDKDGLEGSHFYKRGDYYYIYATYGGWPSGQAVFRSKSPFGPYEEQMVVEKSYNNVPNTIHQGALVEDIAGNWWTVMQEDLGALGRMPNLQPMKWVDDWPVLKRSGAPYKSFTDKIVKPAFSGNTRVKRLPTTDAFRDYPLGMQWEWNHLPDNNAWSLFERPGWLRLKTSNVTTKLPQARNMLTQRIFAMKNKETTGTVRIDTRGMTEGDRAGICILQDPYGMICIEMVDGKLQLRWEQDKVRDNNSKSAEKTQAVELEDSIIYLRAGIKYEENKAKFYYSTDNKTWKRFGSETSQSFNLSVFVGSRFGLFCYATKKKGGYADFDWFTTEDNFDEAEIYPATFTAPTEKAATVSKIALPATQKTIDVMIGDKRLPIVTATYADKATHTANVAAYSTFKADNAGIVEFKDGQMLGVGQGSTNVNVSYTDIFGNKSEASFTAKSSYFPLDQQYVRNDLGGGSGTYRQNANNSVFKFVEVKNQQGWVYFDDVDMSDYRYLVIKLSTKQSAGAKVNIYTTEKLAGACHSTPLSTTDATTVVDLSEAKYTSTTNKNKALDLKKVRMVTFQGTVANKTIVLADMYLTNDPMADPTGIGDVVAKPQSAFVSVYSVSGQIVRSNVSRSQALQGLAPGLYIVDGKKVMVK